MKITDYLKDKFLTIILMLISLIVLVVALYLLNINKFLIEMILVIFIIIDTLILVYEFNKKNKFYQEFYRKLNELDKKYLIAEIIKNPSFSEGNILLDILYEIDKSYLEELNKYKYNMEEFKEYIELWCHEIKMPIATTNLIVENNKNKVTESIKEEIIKTENLIEQILYYSRSDFVEKDYLISEINLLECVNNVIKRNKKDILSKKIKVNVFKDNIMVYSDKKWIEFILNQIILNSIKYTDKEGNITIKYQKNVNNVILEIIDNGIGIKESELSRVFDKGFTGSNGRIKTKSTGIGLYLCKKLCLKLGHDISITSKENDGSKVTLVFPNSSMMN